MNDSNLWVTRCPVPTASSVALDRGLLNDALDDFGLTVRALQDASDPALHAAHFHHDLSGLVREGGNVPALWARSAGADTRLVALTWIDEYQAILTNDPAIDSAAALVGRRLGVVRHPDALIDFRAAMALRGFEAALSLAGAGLADAEVVDLSEEGYEENGWGPDGRQPGGVWDLELAALRGGAVDAIYVKGAPGVAAARPDGIYETVEFGFHPDPSVRVNNGTPRTITVATPLLEQEGLVAQILATLIRAADWAAENGGEFSRILASETRGGIEDVRDAYGSARLHPDLREDWIDALDVQRRFLLGQGLQDSDFDVRTWIDPEPLASAREMVAAAGSTA
jgi:ABC-type nitrate/sulfonate/bicarbonate transport system substrate-binding protein